MAALLAKALAIAVFIHAPCPGDSPEFVAAFGSACAQAPTTIYVMAPLPHMTYMHELGHVVDYNFLTDQDRGTFLYLIHSKRPWLGGANAPNERFAEAFQHCVQNPARIVGGTFGYGYLPRARTHRRICRWMATIGARYLIEDMRSVPLPRTSSPSR